MDSNFTFNENQDVVYSVTDGIESPATRKKYKYNLKLFMDHFDFNSETELLENKDPRYIEGMIIRYIKTLSENNLKHETIHNKIAPILHFYEINDVILNKRKIRSFNVGDRSMREDEAYTHDQIRMILAKCDVRSTVIVLLMASAGIRIGAIPRIKLKHLNEIQDLTNIILSVALKPVRQSVHTKSIVKNFLRT